MCTFGKIGIHIVRLIGRKIGTKYNLFLVYLRPTRLCLNNFFRVLLLIDLKGLSHEKEQGSDATLIDRSPFKDVSAG